MKNKIIGILVCMLMIVTVLPAVNAVDVQSPNTFKRGLITIQITSKVYEVNDPYNLLNGVIKVNGGIGGHYVYDSGTPDSDPDLTRGRYKMTSSSCMIALNGGGGILFKTDPSAVDMGIYIYNDYENTDGYNLYSSNNLQLSNGMSVNGIGWDLWDTDMSFFSSDALPTTAPIPLTEWESNILHIYGDNPSNPAQQYSIRAHITSAKKDKAVTVYGPKNNEGAPSVMIPYSYPSLQLWVNVFQRFSHGFPMLRHFLVY